MQAERDANMNALRAIEDEQRYGISFVKERKKNNRYLLESRIKKLKKYYFLGSSYSVSPCIHICFSNKFILPFS
jgi:hypothetical protein